MCRKDTRFQASVVGGYDRDETETYEQVRPRPPPRKRQGRRAANFSVRVAALSKGDHLVIRGRPCKIVDIGISGCACRRGPWAHFITVDILTGKRLDAIIRMKLRVDAPVLVHAEYALINITPPTLSLLTDDNMPKDDVDLPRFAPLLAAKLQEAFDNGADLRVQTLSVLGEEAVVGFTEVAGDEEY